MTNVLSIIISQNVDYYRLITLKRNQTTAQDLWPLQNICSYLLTCNPSIKRKRTYFVAPIIPTNKLKNNILHCRTHSNKYHETYQNKIYNFLIIFTSPPPSLFSRIAIHVHSKSDNHEKVNLLCRKISHSRTKKQSTTDRLSIAKR